MQTILEGKLPMSLNSRLRTFHLIRGTRASPLIRAAAAALAAATLAALPASAQSTAVYGGPKFAFGRLSPEGAYTAVNDAGASVGYAPASDENLGTRAIRWGASGTTQLGILGTAPNGFTGGAASAIN